jgi:hypothetical protein
VVSTPLKNISQLGLLFPIYRKKESVPNHQPVSMVDSHHSTLGSAMCPPPALRASFHRSGCGVPKGPPSRQGVLEGGGIEPTMFWLNGNFMGIWQDRRHVPKV